ncbi:MAG: replication-associated recombination protein A [Phycisphaerales bacterium]|nr:replication-associated recombination protein A [Phycisphaerales bacterium]
MPDLWQEQREQRREAVEPLPHRMRPRTLDEMVGQPHLLDEGMIVRRMVDSGVVGSLVLHGPPGTGKTTLAELIARQLDAHLERENAAMVGVKRIREILHAADHRLGDSGRRTILLLDEIHRFSRSQQDVLLGDVERGRIALIGATTENPWYTVNAALVSRSTILGLEPLDDSAVMTLLKRAVVDPRGLGSLEVRIDDDAISHFAARCDGDARRALQALELAARSQVGSTGETSHPIHIDLAAAEQSIRAKAIVYDRDGDQHYDTISAFIKSMRGSDPDAAVYWLAKMLHAGEDPRFIARRIAIFASEDVGNADPEAIRVAEAAWQLVERIGMPECQLTLSQAAIYMAAAPKSGASSQAIWAAMAEVREGRTHPVPRQLISGMKSGRDPDSPKYVSPHTAADGVGTTEYLGVDRIYYQPTTSGREQDIAERLAAFAERRKAAGNRGNGEET